MKYLAIILALTTAIPAHAGGPVIEEAYEAEPAPKMKNGEKIALAALGIAVLAILSGRGDNCTAPEPEPLPEDPC